MDTLRTPIAVRRLVACLGLALAAALLVVLPAPQADAASWTTVFRADKARLQLCKVPVKNGIKIRARVDNRRSEFAHIAGVTRTRGEQRKGVYFRVKPGKLTRTKSLVYRAGDEAGVGMSRPGGGAGGSYSPREIGRC